VKNLQRDLIVNKRFGKLTALLVRLGAQPIRATETRIVANRLAEIGDGAGEVARLEEIEITARKERTIVRRVGLDRLIKVKIGLIVPRAG
jgi:hypothetical protein